MKRIGKRIGFTAAIACLQAACAASALGATPAAAPPSLETLDLEQLMEIEVVVAASKRAQTTREVPSFVSVVTAAQIQAHGYRTLADVLKTLPSFYISNDRNYSFVGVRGFQRAGDYNSRILLLINGLRTNDSVYDSALIGEEGLVDLDMVERIEVIRGPSAAIYGSNAFFAVINVVTRTGGSVQGVELAASAASFGTWAGRASYGKAFASGWDVLFSATLSDSEGRRLFFPEFDDPATNNGITEGADGESFRKLLATVSKGNFSLQASHVLREKQIPTGAFGTLFNDPRTKTNDSISLASLGYHRLFAGGSSLAARAHAGYWLYEGDYAYVPELLPGRDEDYGEWWGVDVDGGRRVGRHFLTVGAEYRDNYRQDAKTFDQEPLFVYTDLKNSSRRWGTFAQDEVRIFQALTLYAGLRYDRYESFGSMVSPRGGLIYSPDSATTVKLLAGRAFRAPSEFELFYESTAYAPNPRLRPERIGTLELVAQRFIGGGAQITVAAFHNHLSALVSQFLLDDGRLGFSNAEEIESKGLEIALRVNRGHGPSGQIGYSLQRTQDRATGVRLTNSPRHMVGLDLLTPLPGSFTAGLDTQYVSGRGTIRGNTARAYTLTNLSLRAPRLFGRLDASATIYNLFDVDYGVPWGEDVVQEIITQDGRSFRVKTTLRF